MAIDRSNAKKLLMVEWTFNAKSFAIRDWLDISEFEPNVFPVAVALLGAPEESEDYQYDWLFFRWMEVLALHAESLKPNELEIDAYIEWVIGEVNNG